MTLRVIAELSGEAKPSERGWKYRDVYRLVEIEGTRHLERYDRIDIQEEINSHAASVDFGAIIKAYDNGDMDALDRARAFYADVSELPKNLSEVIAINSRGKDIFESFPREVRELFNNNYYEFLKNPKAIEDWYLANNKDYRPEEEIKPEPDVKDVVEDD